MRILTVAAALLLVSSVADAQAVRRTVVAPRPGQGNRGGVVRQSYTPFNGPVMGRANATQRFAPNLSTSIPTAPFTTTPAPTTVTTTSPGTAVRSSTSTTTTAPPRPLTPNPTPGGRR